MLEKSIVFVTGGSGFIGRNLIRALGEQGHEVRALARSDRSAKIVENLGAMPVRGDLMDYESLDQGMNGADLLFHLAADTSHGLDSTRQDKTNLEGTRNVYKAAKSVGVTPAVHLSSEAVLLSGKPLINAEETTPYPDKFAGGYSRSKALAEQVALRANGEGLEVVVVRPRFVWGRDDTTALPQLIDAAKSGKLAWISGGHYPISTTHIANAVHGMILAVEKGRAGEIYFVTDGDPLDFRTFITEMLATQNVAAPTKSVPRVLVKAVVKFGEILGKFTAGKLKGPMSWQEYGTLGVPVTLDISKACRELDYQAVITVEEGMRELSRLE